VATCTQTTLNSKQSLIKDTAPLKHVAEAINLVLYIEDNPSNIKLVLQLLAHHNNIQLLTAHTLHPELILLDINLPGMDGYQVMAQLKALNDPLLPPIVILTAQNTKGYLLQAHAISSPNLSTVMNC
jgi:CheY-like chemotaxis protein